MQRRTLVFIMGLVLALGATGAWADGVIDILPNGVTTTTLASSGSYRLAGDVTMTSAIACFQITSDEVTLDLNGHTLDGASLGFGIGLQVVGASGTRIHNGTVKNFTGTGMLLQTAPNTWVHDVVFRSNFDGVFVNGTSDNSLFERCRFLENTEEGIQIQDSGGENRVVQNCQMSQNAVGCNIAAGQGDLVLNNVVTDNTSVGLAIWGTDTVVAGNTVTRNGTGIHNGSGSAVFANNLAVANTSNYSSVSPVTSLAASNEWGDNLAP